jgi:hypothetical protein
MSSDNKKKDTSLNCEIRITNVPEKMKNTLYNIRKNMGVSESAMLKPIIAKFIAEQPDDLKREYKE